MNRIVLANGESELDGGNALDAARQLDKVSAPAIVACGELDVSLKLQRERRTGRLAPERPLPRRSPVVRTCHISKLRTRWPL